MIHHAAKKMSDNLIRGHVIIEEDRELYEYGFAQGIIMIFNFLTSVLVGVLLGQIWESIMFTICYMPVRIFAGGYHAKKPKNCYILSTLMITVVLLLTKYMVINNIMRLSIVLVTGVCLFLFAPSEAENKPLSDSEIKIYRGRAIAIWSFEVLVMALSFFYGFVSIEKGVLVSSLAVTVMIILGELNRRKRK